MRRILVVVVLMASFLGIAATPAYAPEWCPDWMISGNLRVESAGSSAFVTAEVSWTEDSYALLRARTPDDMVGSWELFRFVCVQGPDVYAIRSVANGRYVSAELNWSGNSYGMLRARATSIGAWETFRISGSYAYTIRSMANNRYVSTEVSWTGNSYATLRARATSAGPWEFYSFYNP